MRISLVNPPWSFQNSIYFGCTEPHLPLELGAAKVLLEQDGHEVQLLDGHLFGQTIEEIVDAVVDFCPNMTVVTTAPTYLFWRCAQPELRVPRSFIASLRGRGGMTVAVGPHGSVTPEMTLAKLGVDVVARGECEETIARLARGGDLGAVPAIAYHCGAKIEITGDPASTRFTDLPAIVWPREWIMRHAHQHHRFDAQPIGSGAEVEASRGCPYSCSFCAKLDFRDQYRRRDLNILLVEIDDLISKGAAYLYFIDEIFLPQKPLLEALCEREIVFGVQTRIDLWKPDMLELLGRAGCVSIEAGVESLTEAGRDSLAKNCRMTTDELAERLIIAKRHVPFVQANLIEVPEDDQALIQSWRDLMLQHGIWANDPVPLYPYPSSPQYRQMWGQPDDHAWERAHAYYLDRFGRLSDIQQQNPLPLGELETACCGR